MEERGTMEIKVKNPRPKLKVFPLKDEYHLLGVGPWGYYVTIT